jgi:MinD-like ATPase involved in chromosome partitioning or flagellar assembly
MLISLVAAKGSPGVTTTALALAATWPSPVVLAECDLAGGDVSAGLFGGTLEQRPGGLLDLALAARRGVSAEDVIRRCTPMPMRSGARLLPGIRGPAQRKLVTAKLAPIADAFRRLADGSEPCDVIADCGRVSDSLPTDLLERCDAIVVVLRPTLGAVHHARELVRALSESMPGLPDETLGVVVVGDRPYSPKEVADAIELPMRGAVPVDLTNASALRGEAVPSRSFARSPLIRAAAAMTQALTTPTHLSASPALLGGA